MHCGEVQIGEASALAACGAVLVLLLRYCNVAALLRPHGGAIAVRADVINKRRHNQLGPLAKADIIGLRVSTGRDARQFITAFVLRVAGMAFHPAPIHLMLLTSRIQTLP